MYRKVDWMTAADQSILRILGPPKSLELTPSNVARNVGLSRGYTSERLRELLARGLVAVDDETGTHPYYRITGRGERVLRRELTPEQLAEAE